MAMIEKKNENLEIKKSGDYTTQSITNIDKQIFQMIRERFNLEPALGDAMFVRGRFYVTSTGCSRIAEQKKVRSIHFEYEDPSTCNIPLIRKNPENYLMVICRIEKEDGGVVEGRRTLDFEKEKRIDNKGREFWLLKDYMNFTETKAFMRAVGKAYNVEIYDDLPDDMKKDGKTFPQAQSTGEECPMCYEKTFNGSKCKSCGYWVEPKKAEQPEKQPDKKVEIKEEDLDETKKISDPYKWFEDHPQKAGLIEVKPNMVETREKAILISIPGFFGERTFWLPRSKTKMGVDGQTLLIEAKMLKQKADELNESP